MKSIVTAICLCLFATPAFAADPPKPPRPPAPLKCDCCKPVCNCGGPTLTLNPDCECFGCPCCNSNRFVDPAVTHVSPDGTVNRLCADGVYRACPGVAKQTPPAGAFAPPSCANGRCQLPPAYPAYLPPAVTVPQSCPTCPGGNCPAAPTRRFFR